ncbi:cytochrome b [Thiomicrorhabdus chilensis]|uniref:cytochrome b n=1 Tax=Thiomicrorhabdus chilensis TaxID=63656 RepID=UPI0004205BC2|nr:cytochrome b [Thiomicrorhabdus chilensis]
MLFKNTPDRYGWISISLHWMLAAALFSLFALGVWMVELDYYSNWYHDAPFIHKSIGVLLVMMMVLRFIWVRLNPKPKPLSKNAKLNFVAGMVHGVLYVLVFALGISGYLISTAEGQGVSVFDWFNVPAWLQAFEGQADVAGEVHEWLAYGLMTLVGLHALGALKHHFIDRDKTLMRMLRPGSDSQ